MKTISEEFPSNCLWEALKAKLKDWANVKIIKLGKDINSNGTHYMWTNKAENKVYHFRGMEEPHFPFYRLRFKGILQEDNLDLFNKFLYSSAKHVVDRQLYFVTKKYGLDKISDLVGMHYIEDNDYPNPEDARTARAVQKMVQVAHKTKDGLNIQFISVNDTQKLNEALKDSAYWQYVTEEECPFYRLILGPDA